MGCLVAAFGDHEGIGVGHLAVHVLIPIQLAAVLALPVRFRTVLVAGSGNFSNLDEHVLVHTEAAVGVLVQAEARNDVILVGNGALVRTAGDLHVVRRILLAIGEDDLLVARTDERSAAYDHLAVLEALGTHEIENTTLGAI